MPGGEDDAVGVELGAGAGDASGWVERFFWNVDIDLVLGDAGAQEVVAAEAWALVVDAPAVDVDGEVQ